MRLCPLHCTTAKRSLTSACRQYCWCWYRDRATIPISDPCRAVSTNRCNRHSIVAVVVKIPVSIRHMQPPQLRHQKWRN